MDWIRWKLSEKVCVVSPLQIPNEPNLGKNMFGHTEISGVATQLRQVKSFLFAAFSF